MALGTVAGRRRQRLQGLNKIPSCMRPTADQRGIRDLAIADITVTLQVTPKSRQKLSRIGSLPSRLILVEHNRGPLSPRSIEPHVGFLLGPAARFMEYGQRRFIRLHDILLNQGVLQRPINGFEPRVRGINNPVG